MNNNQPFCFSAIPHFSSYMLHQPPIICSTLITNFILCFSFFSCPPFFLLPSSSPPFFLLPSSSPPFFLLPSSSPPFFLLPSSSPPFFLLPSSSPPLPSYIRCFYWAVLTVSGIHDLEERNPTTTVEYTVEMLGYLLGIFIIAVFIGEVGT